MRWRGDFPVLIVRVAAEALISLLDSVGTFEGTPEALLDALCHHGLEREKWSTRRLGKQLSKIWAHIKAQYSAEKTRTGSARGYRFGPKPGIPDNSDVSDPLFQQTPTREDSTEVSVKTPFETSVMSWTESGSCIEGETEPMPAPLPILTFSIVIILTCRTIRPGMAK